MTTNFVQKGCEVIKSAIQKDNEEDYVEALSLYSYGIQYLMTGLKYEKNRKVQAAIKEKVQKYLTRAEEIKSALSPSTTKTKKRKKTKKKLHCHLHKYPTHQQINDAIDDTNQQTIHLIHGYIRSMETLLNINYSIPNGIVKLCLVYYHIPVEYTPDPQQHIVFDKPNIKWDDVAGLTNAKRNLKECVILPLKFPALFANRTSNKRSNILLYGPPGTGKTLLSKAVATATNNATFFSLSGSDLCCRYSGDTEKLIRNVFAMARNNKPSIICFDEMDSLCPVRRGSFEYPRRNMAEFLVQLQDVSNSQIVVIGITNCPWNVSPVVRRRFTKRIYVPLPDQEARAEMFRIHIGDASNNLSQQDYVRLGQMTEGFSGSDISAAVQDALMEPVRNLQNATYFKRIVDEHDGSDYKLMPCKTDDDGAMQMRLLDIPDDEQNKIIAEPMEMKQFLHILGRCKANVSAADIQRHIDWRNEFEEEE